MTMTFVTAWLGAVPGYMTPLLLASVGLILCERSGVLNLGVEGIMAVGAMAGAVAALAGSGAGMALLWGTAAGLLVSVPFILAVVVFRAPMIPAGLALVAIGLGASGALGREAAHKTFPGLPSLGLPEALTGLPLVGRMLFAQDPVVYLAIALAAVASFVLFRTRAGLQLRAVGEDPATADAAGVDVQLHQLLGCLAGCTLIGLAGAYLSVGGSQTWTEGMVAGRGWIALALVVFASWKTERVLLGAWLFGGLAVLQINLQAAGTAIPVAYLSMAPYLATIVVLVIISSDRRRAAINAPASLGRVFHATN